MSHGNRISIIISLFFLFIVTAKGQMTIDAGEDTTYCVGTDMSTMRLGDNLVIKKANTPYTIKWECKVNVSENLIFTANDFLDDTTSVSPKIIDYLTWPEWIKFMVHVTDSENQYAKDSIDIRFSSFNYLLGYFSFTLNQGDSVLLNAPYIGGGIEPLAFFYEPQSGLSSPNELVTWAKPDTTTLYSQVAIDSCGCISEPNHAYLIHIIPTVINNLRNDTSEKLNIRQIGSKLFFDNPSNLNSTMKVFSLNGQLILNSFINGNYFDFKETLMNNRIYVVSITIGNITENKKIKIY